MHKKMTQTAVLAGICMLLTLTGLGFIKTPLLSVTFVHLPVILGTLLVGKKEGLILGLVFGLCSLYQNLVSPTVTSFVFYHPLVSLFPRVMIPVMVMATVKLMGKCKKDWQVIVSAAVGSLTNTVLVLGMIYLLFAARYAAALNISQAAVGGVLLTTALTNGIGEAVLVSILTYAIYKALKKDIIQ